MAAEMDLVHCNYDTYKQPIAVHQLIIRRGITNNRQYGIQQKLENIFSKYGKIWSYELSGKDLVFIAYDNEKSRDLAVENENGKVFMNQKLTVGLYVTKLYNEEQLISLKLKHPDIDMNQLQNCNNYWNKQLYPENIVEYGLKNGLKKRFVAVSIYCHHKDIPHPFIILMASENRMKQHIICIRPQTLYEIGEMLRKCDISLLKQVLPHTNTFGVDWRYYKLREFHLLTHYVNHAFHDNIKYMINVIKCDPTDSRYELLHSAAGMHDIKLVDICLNEYEINPLLLNKKWKARALDECNYAWKKYQKKCVMNDDGHDIKNIVHFKNDQGEGEQEDDDDIKNEEYVALCPNISIKSILFGNFLYVTWDGKICFLNVDRKFRSFAQFTLQNIEENKYLIKIKTGSQLHERIKSLKGDKDIESDYILTANIKEQTVEFSAQNKEILNGQCCWFINKEIKGNDYGYTFHVKIESKKYQLFAAKDYSLKLQEIIMNEDQDDNKIECEEGSDFNETLKSWFVVLRDHQFGDRQIKYGITYEWQQSHYESWLLNLKGDKQTCQRIHDIIVEKLEKAMKIQKLHGHQKENNKEIKDGNNNENDGDKLQKYKAKKVIFQDQDTGQYQQRQRKLHKTRKEPPMYPPEYRSNQAMQHEFHKQNRYPTLGNNDYQNNNNDTIFGGICKKWNDIKGYGFIKMNDGSGDIFVHKSEIKSGSSILYQGQKVKFNIITQDDGRRKAINVISMNQSAVKYNNRFIF